MIVLDGDLLRITSELGGWSVAVPYYFFIFAVNDATGPDARRTQTVAVTMGTAPDAAQPGYSQATLVLFFSPKAHSQGFVETWSERFGIRDLPRKKIGATAFESQGSYDSATRLIGDFTAAEHALKQALKGLAKGRFFSVAPYVLMQPLEKIEGGLCEIEVRIIREIAIGAGASKVVVWVGPELSDAEVKEKLRGKKTVV